MATDSLLHSEPDELLNKAAAELRQQLETGRDCRAETVLSAFPSLASDPQRALELVVLEFYFRRQLGQNPDPCQWYDRFPHWREQLRARLEALPPDDLNRSQHETAALGTSPYSDANQCTLIDIPLDEVPLLGRHEILKEIGRGGMGVVYQARDLVLERQVALKVIRSGSLASTEEVRCFYREARSAAGLRHPNIVPIHGMGLHEGQHCFSMALFPRGSLTQHLNNYHQDIRAAVVLAAKAARAVHTAHVRGIVHRDLKPGNILLDERGEPVVSDFGLAKRLDIGTTQTLGDHPIGTPAYMAPEQARCEAATAASDIWSLGVILYELLTGSRPFTGESVEAVKDAVLQAEPVSPRRLRRNLPRDLGTIVLTCLAKEPARRYASAGELADELERWLAGEPIQTRPESRWQRLRRSLRTKRVVRSSVPTWLLMVLLLLSTGAAGTWAIVTYFSPEAQKRRREEQVLASLQREPIEGRSVTLVGPLGPPKWSRWRTERERPPLPELRKWPLKLPSIEGVSLLDLLPDPQQMSYRYSAEVAPANRNEMEIGLYFGCEELATASGPEHCFSLFRLKFSIYHLKSAQLCIAGYQEGVVNDESNWLEFLLPFHGQPGLAALVSPRVAIDRGKIPWHRIEVDVTPDEVRAFCDGCLMGELALPVQRRKINLWWQTTHEAPFRLPTLQPRGSLGLYVREGPAYYRNVTVEPLPKP
jgi:serine/threonine protein kinase